MKKKTSKKLAVARDSVKKLVKDDLRGIRGAAGNYSDDYCLNVQNKTGDGIDDPPNYIGRYVGETTIVGRTTYRWSGSHWVAQR